MNEYFSGFVSGISQTLVGFPFDTLIVHRQINKQINLQNIYRGIQYPLLTSSLINGISFGLNNNINSVIHNYYISGFISGIITSFIINPVELYKIRTQSSKKMNISISTGIKQTIMRESVASSIYFGSYYSMRDLNLPVFISGGLAGIISWIFSFPLDTIKTRIQSGKCKNTFECIKMGKLYSGLKLCILRAGLVNSIGFYVYNYFNEK